MTYIYLISYDISTDSNTNTNSVIREIEKCSGVSYSTQSIKFQDYLHIQKSVWVIETTMTADKIIKKLYGVMNKNLDSVFITTIPSLHSFGHLMNIDPNDKTAKKQNEQWLENKVSYQKL